MHLPCTRDKRTKQVLRKTGAQRVKEESRTAGERPVAKTRKGPFVSARQPVQGGGERETSGMGNASTRRKKVGAQGLIEGAAQNRGKNSYKR